MSSLTLLDLFSGIGGFSLGLEQSCFKTVQLCEIDSFCRSILQVRFPGVPLTDDVKNVVPMAVDAICAGFPCQDASIAQPNERLGIKGPRTGLWKEVKRLVAAIRPAVVVLENVPGLLSAGFGVVLGDLAEIGYDAEWRCIAASTAGFIHRRERLWVVAYPASSRLSRYVKNGGILGSAEKALTEHGNGTAGTWRALERDIAILRGRDGLPLALHRRRVKALGNALVPAIAAAIGREIERCL